MAELELKFPLDHPAAAGHFPGNPIIPGASLLGGTLCAIESALDCCLIPCEIRLVKFLHPVRPGDCVVVAYERTDESRVRFSCIVGGRIVMTGQAACRATP